MYLFTKNKSKQSYLESIFEAQNICFGCKIAGLLEIPIISALQNVRETDSINFHIFRPWVLSLKDHIKHDKKVPKDKEKTIKKIIKCNIKSSIYNFDFFFENYNIRLFFSYFKNSQCSASSKKNQIRKGQSHGLFSATKIANFHSKHRS